MIKLTVKDTSNHNIQETIAINILKIPVTEMTNTKGVRITEVIKMIIGIKKAETTGIEVIGGKENNMIIHATMKESMKNIPIETGTGAGFFIIGMTEVKEINNAAGRVSLKV